MLYVSNYRRSLRWLSTYKKCYKRANEKDQDLIDLDPSWHLNENVSIHRQIKSGNQSASKEKEGEVEFRLSKTMKILLLIHLISTLEFADYAYPLCIATVYSFKWCWLNI